MRKIVLIATTLTLTSCSFLQKVFTPSSKLADQYNTERETQLTNEYPSKDTVEFSEKMVAYYINDKLKQHCNTCLPSFANKFNKDGNYIPSNSYQMDLITQERPLRVVTRNATKIFGYVFEETEMQNVINTRKSEPMQFSLDVNRIMDYPNPQIIDYRVTDAGLIDNEYLSRNCSGYFTAMLDANAKLPTRALEAGIKANHNVNRAGSIMIIGGTFDSPYRNKSDNNNSNGLRYNSFLWKYYRNEANREATYYTLNTMGGYLMTRFKKQSEKGAYNASLTIDAGKPTSIGINANVGAGFSFTNLFQSREWVYVISETIQPDDFSPVSKYDGVKKYFNEVYLGKNKPIDDILAAGVDVVIEFPFPGLDPHIGDDFLSKVLPTPNIFSSSSVNWKKELSDNQDIVYTAVVTATVSSSSTNLSASKDFIIDWQFYHEDGDEIKLRARSTHITSGEPKVDLNSSTITLTNQTDPSTKEEFYVQTEPVSVDITSETVDIDERESSVVEITNQTSLPDLGISANLIKVNDEYYLKLSSNKRFPEGYFQNLSTKSVVINFNIPLYVNGVKINRPASARLYYQIPQQVDVSEIVPPVVTGETNEEDLINEDSDN